MTNSTKTVLQGLFIGFLLSLLASAIPTFMDWYTNPAGLFHGAGGTHWKIVFETMFSWLWPFFMLFGPVSIAVVTWRASRRAKRAD